MKKEYHIVTAIAIISIILIGIICFSSCSDLTVEWRAKNVGTGVVKLIRKEMGYKAGDTVEIYGYEGHYTRYVLLNPVDTLNQ